MVLFVLPSARKALFRLETRSVGLLEVARKLEQTIGGGGSDHAEIDLICRLLLVP